jgi:uncharacterized membrane protein YqiK
MTGIPFDVKLKVGVVFSEKGFPNEIDAVFPVCLSKKLNDVGSAVIQNKKLK